MKVYPQSEYRCGTCWSMMDWNAMTEERVRVKCRNRGCPERGKEFEVEVVPLEAKRVGLTEDDVDQEPESAQSIARRYGGSEP